jgi:hypothetical protein
MSSAAVAVSTPTTNTTSEKPVKRVAPKRVPKTAAAPAVESEKVEQSVAVPTVPAVPAVPAVPVGVDETTTTTVAKKRAPRKNTKAASSDEKNAEAAATPAVAVASTPVASLDADGDAEADGDAADADNTPAVKRTRTPRPPRVFIAGFGDQFVDPKERKYTKEEYEEWKAKTLYAVQNIRFKEWGVLKRKYNLNWSKIYKKNKRVSKGCNLEATAENHLRRLKEMPREEFANLDNTWLSNYQFSGAYDAETITRDGCPAVGASATYTVYIAALHHGYKPLGIVSENGSKTGPKPSDIVFTTSVGDARREYVGVSLPFQGKERSKYAILAKDRVAAAQPAAVAVVA